MVILYLYEKYYNLRLIIDIIAILHKIETITELKNNTRLGLHFGKCVGIIRDR